MLTLNSPNLWIINLNLILTYNMYFLEYVSFDWFPLCKLKWNWPGHVVRRTDNHWTTCITFWMPHGRTRNGGRPRMRWRDDLDSFVKHWHHVTQNVVQWRSVGKAYIQQWTFNSWNWSLCNIFFLTLKLLKDIICLHLC